MNMIADRVWDTRERTFVEERDGEVVLIKKLFAAGLGMVCISNQALLSSSELLPVQSRRWLRSLLNFAGDTLIVHCGRELLVG